MRILFLSLAIAGACSPLFAQRSHGGTPYRWGTEPERQATLPEVRLHPLNTATLIAEEGPASASFHYGVQRFVEADVVNEGEWFHTAWEGRVCRLRLSSPGAAMLSVQFDRWELPEGAMVYLYNTDRTSFIGGFDRSNRSPQGTMATAVVPGDALIIEYHVPDGADPGQLRVASVTHGYRDIFHFAEAGLLRDYDPGYQSSPCHNNVICPEAAAWGSQKRAVAMFLRPDGQGCSGSLINNTQTPGRPYFYLANHCYQPNEDEWVFYFNYEAPACVGDAGPTNETLTGAVHRANLFEDDFALIELNDAPQDAGYSVFYAGWDRTGATPQNTTVIHHPLYDVKKITFDNQAATSYVNEGIQLWKSFWDDGIVEAVSSGAPLFDQNKRIIGHMNEGAQDCTNAATVFTGCAKFVPSWDGLNAATRLRDWLDPANTTTQLNGFTPTVSTPLVRVRVKAFLEGPFNTGDGTMTAALRANGLVPLTEPYTALGYTHVGGGGEATTATVLAVATANAVVDWVVIELRGAVDATDVLATRSALLQRDGDIVDMDGTSDVLFNMAPGDYHIAVRHRNHFGIMTAAAHALTATATPLDLSAGMVALFGGANATKGLGGKQVMYAGDVTRDGIMKYTGEDNDRDPILQRIGGTVPTHTVPGYFREDVNLDGTVKYIGEFNDRDIILVNIGGTVPTAVRNASLP